MTDPLTGLRAPIAPADPDPAFAATLRARIARALDLPRGVAVSTAIDVQPETTAPTTGAAIPYLALADARRALDWYVDIFGARLVGEPIVMSDGRIGHAELALADGTLYLADESPDLGVTAPRPGEAAVSLMLTVEDADDTRTRAVAAGAHGDRPPYDGYGFRNAWIVDPFGHRWGLQSPIAVPTPPRYRHGEIGYVSLWVPDAQRASRFYAAVLGWEYEPSRTEYSAHVAGATPSIGIWGSQPRPTAFCSYAVDDLTGAVQRVRAAGGTAGDPTHEPFGLSADCVDDQGTRFALHERPAGSAGSAAPTGADGSGGLVYLTFEVLDSARTRAFYGTVLGWTFSPGTVPDGWQVEDTMPMVGIAGGRPENTGVPMWQVPDLAAAIERVRASGGTATDPERQPYGLTSACTDDQGGRFHLGEF